MWFVIGMAAGVFLTIVLPIFLKKLAKWADKV